MARKKLNMKVVIPGLILLTILVIIGGVVVWPKVALRLGWVDPHKRLDEARNAKQAQRYSLAERYYLEAFRSAKDDAFKIELLFELAEFHAIHRIDVPKENPSYHEADWMKVRSCWERIKTIDPRQIGARRKLLDFYYEVSDNGANVWDLVETESDGLVNVYRQQGMEPDPLVLLALGRSKLEKAISGQVSNRDTLRDEAVAILENVKKVTPRDPKIYLYLAQAEALKGQLEELRGIQKATETAAQKSLEILKQGKETIPDNPDAHINYLMERLGQARTDKDQIAKLETDFEGLGKLFPDSAKCFAVLASYYQTEGMPKQAMEAIQKARDLDPTHYDYAFQAAIMYYRQAGLDVDTADSTSWFDQAIAIATEALTYPDTQLVPGPREGIQSNRRYSLLSLLAGWHIEKYRLEKDPKTLAEAENAIQQIQQFLKTSDNVYMGKWRGMLDLAKGQVEMEAASSETDPKLKIEKNRKANKKITEAVTTLYAAYQQLAGLKQDDPLLSYVLAEAFRGRKEFGARMEFLTKALFSRNNSIAIMKPNVILDYAETELGARNGSIAISAVDSYETSYPPNPRSREIRFQALLLTGQYDQAEEWIGKSGLDPTRIVTHRTALIHKRIVSLNNEINRIQEGLLSIEIQQKLLAQAPPSDDPDIAKRLDESRKKLLQDHEKDSKEIAGRQKQVEELNPQRLQIVESAMQKDPQSVDPAILMDVCRQLEKNGNIDQAKKLAAVYIQTFPQYVPMRTFYKTLESPIDKTKSEEEQTQQLADYSLASIQEALSDPIDQAVETVRFHLTRSTTDPIRRARHLERARSALKSIGDRASDDPRILELSFDLALVPESDQADAKPDLTAARMYAQKAKELDLDQCGGLFFLGRIELADRQFVSAIEKFTECIRIRPIFPEAYHFRSIAQQARNYLSEAAKDADRAFELTRIEGEIARNRANVYYQIFLKAGSNPTPEEYSRMSEAVRIAIGLNPENLPLMDLYANLIGDREPDIAMGIRQRLMARYPSVEHGRLLALLALRQYDVSPVVQRDYLLLIAEDALNKAKALAPNDPELLSAWGKYLRVAKKQGQAEQILAQDPLAMALFYIDDGQFAKAQAILRPLYDNDQKNNPTVLYNLAVIASKTGNPADIERYTEELISVVKNPESELIQIQMFLEARMDTEKTRKKLASFRERYPDHIGGLLMQALYDFNEGRPDDALSRVNDILTQQPNHAVAWRIRGVIHRMKSDFGKSIDDLQKSLSLVDDPVARIELALTYDHKGDTTSAIGQLVTAMEKSQAPMRIRYYLESIYQRTDRKTELIKLYEDTAAKHPDDAYWLFRVGESTLKQYQDLHAQEKKQAQQQGKLKPGDSFTPSEKVTVLLDKARTYLEHSWNLTEGTWQNNPAMMDQAKQRLDYYLESRLQGLETQTQLTQFIRIASKYAETPLAPIAHSQMAQAHLKLGDRTRAIEIFDKALESAKSQPEYIVLLLDMMQKVLASEKEVRAWCDRTLAADPRHIGANYTLYQLSQKNGQYDKAFGYIDLCLSQLEKQDDTWVEYTIQKSQTMILAFLRTGDKRYLDGGVGLYESILQASPNHPKIPLVLNNLAYLLADNNQQVGKAVEYARKALAASPGDPVRMDTLGYTLAKNNQFGESETMVLKAIQQHELAGTAVPWDVYYHLGIAQEGLKKKAEARVSFEKALDGAGNAISPTDKEQILKAIQRVSQ